MAKGQKKTLIAMGAKAYRIYLFKKQKGLCHWCEKLMDFSRRKNGQPSRSFATFEHLNRRRDGGTMSSDNIVLAHKKCNLKREIEYFRALKSQRVGWWCMKKIFRDDFKYKGD